MKNSIIEFAFVIGFAAASLLGNAHAADTRIFTDDLGRAVEIPTHASRIASLHDGMLTLPLIELGVIPAGSAGRISGDLPPFIRGSKGLTGYDFDNSDIQFLGKYPVDIEKVAALKPDLIISTTTYEDILNKLSAIAPTIIIDNVNNSREQMFETLADITHTQKTLDVLKTRYAQQIKDINTVIDTKSISVNVMQASGGKLYVWHSYFSLGKVLRDAGFTFPKLVEDIAVGERRELSAEKLQDLNADYIFVTYRTDRARTPQDAMAEFEKVIPDFCNYLKACRENRMLMMPREAASSTSFTALGLSAFTVLTHISGNPYAAKITK
ncbi:MAG: ABC transporter substrate-binding protein [Alphaproteobacteria bacterium]|nr:ABC transporter substrate-binding protein [Alphaproteobacteria bacterium]